MVALLVSKTISGGAVSDALAGGGTGVDFGSATSGAYTPLINQTNNTGWMDLYIRHDGINEVTNVKTFIAEYSQAYGGGGANAAADFATLKTKGDSSSTDANNDGNGSGLRIEMDADIPGTLGASAFDGTRAQVKIYSSTGGSNLSNAFDLHEDACVRDVAGTEVDATTPQTGVIGESGNAVLGDRAHIKLRFYVEAAAVTAGIIQWSFIIAYAFTS